MELIFFLIVSFFLYCLVTIFINRSDIKRLKEKNSILENKLGFLYKEMYQAKNKSSAKKETPQPQANDKLKSPLEKSKTNLENKASPTLANPISLTKQTLNNNPSIEKKLLQKLPIYLGSIALILSVVFLVKYSIDKGFFTPQRRVISGLVLGVILMGLAEVIRRYGKLANTKFISQALAGVSIAMLYTIVFASSSLYQMIHQGVGFLFMVFITLLAILLSLLYGLPTAVLGLIGGFLTPILLKSDNPSAVILFSYLAILFLGLSFITKKRQWFLLNLFCILGNFAFAFFWLVENFTVGDTFCVGLFLCVISLFFCYFTYQEKILVKYDKKQIYNATIIASTINFFGALSLLSLTVYQSNFSLSSWLFFIVLSLATIILAYKKPPVYQIAPFIALFLSVVLLILWGSAVPIFILILFVSLFFITSFIGIRKVPQQKIWGILAPLSAVVYYLVGYYLFGSSQKFTFTSFAWSSLALALSLVMFAIYRQIAKVYPQKQAHKSLFMSCFLQAFVAFIAFALWVAVPQQYFALSIAIQIFVMAYTTKMINHNIWRWLIFALTLFFIIVQLPQIFNLLQISFYSIFEFSLLEGNVLPFVKNPFLHLGLPAVLFVLASYYLRLEKDNSLVKIFEFIGVICLCAMFYYVNRSLFHGSENILLIKASFLERAIATNIFFVLGLLSFLFAFKLTRKTLFVCAYILVGIATFRLIYFDLLLYNPLWTSSQKVGSLPIVNFLVLTYALPIVYYHLFVWFLQKQQIFQFSKVLNIWKFILLFVFISFSTRQFFYGEGLDWFQQSIANEFYAYSFTWLCTSLILLFLAIKRKSPALRYASVSFLVITTCKVFLFDTAELDGLLRVFSFMALGASLFGINFLYHKYIFKKTK